MSVALRDLRYAVRSLRKTPTLSVVAVVALALGIGLTTTMFSIIYGGLMKGLPFEGADRIAMLWGANPSRGFERMSPSIQDYRDYAAQSRSFEQLGAYYSGTVNISGAERAERFSGSWVTANVFDITGVRPLLGRTIRAGEDRPGGDRVAVLGYATWKNRYGGDAAIVGQTIRANGVPYVVVGVMPEKFSFPDNTAIWLPLQMDPLVGKRGDGQHVNVVGKLVPGVTLDAASVEAAGIAKRLAAAYKESNEGLTANVRGFVDSQIGPEPQRLLYTMLGAVFVVLLIACANVANLLLDRAAHRSKEVGIRTALGASRSTVVRQFLMEALVLSLAAAAVGVLAAQGGIVAFNRAIADTDPPSWIDIRLHPPVLLFALGIAFLTSLVAGFLPAIQASRADINEILKDESRGASSLHIGRMSRALVMFEIALSVGLLVAAGLMTKSVARLRTMDPGFRTEGIFTARAGFPATYTDTVKQRQFWETLQQRVAALPGVEMAALGSGLPGVNMSGGAFAIEGKTYAKDRDFASARTQTVQPTFFPLFDVRPRAGRLFTSADRLDALPVAIVNEAFVTKYMPGEDPIGRRIRRGRPQGAAEQAPWVTIVGVIPSLYSGETDDPRGPAVYTPLAQEHSNFASLAVRTRGGDPMALTQAVRDVVASLDADIPLYWVYSMTEALARPLWFIRVFGTMFMIFGFIALFLAGIGLYAVMAFSVSRRTREVGIRMALGAQAGHVVQLVLRQGIVQLAVGMTVGLGLAIGVGKLVGMLLYDVQPRDPAVFAGVVGVLAAAGLLACYVPARRATAVDPLIAMRSD